jgi:hypothetical protein
MDEISRRDQWAFLDGRHGVVTMPTKSPYTSIAVTAVALPVLGLLSGFYWLFAMVMGYDRCSHGLGTCSSRTLTEIMWTPFVGLGAGIVLLVYGAMKIRGGGRGGGWFAGAAWFAWGLSVAIRFVMAGNAGV